MTQTSIMVPATIAVTSVAAGTLLTGKPASGIDIIRPIGATCLAFAVLGAASPKAPKITNLFAWTIAGTAVVTIALPIVTKYFPNKD